MDRGSEQFHMAGRATRVPCLPPQRPQGRGDSGGQVTHTVCPVGSADPQIPSRRAVTGLSRHRDPQPLPGTHVSLSKSTPTSFKGDRDGPAGRSPAWCPGGVWGPVPHCRLADISPQLLLLSEFQALLLPGMKYTNFLCL